MINYFRNELNEIKELVGENSKEYNNLYYTLINEEVDMKDIFLVFYDIIEELKIKLDEKYKIEENLNEELYIANNLIDDLNLEIEATKEEYYSEGYTDGLIEGRTEGGL